MVRPLAKHGEGDLMLRRFARLRFVSWVAIVQMALLPLLSFDLRAQTPNVIIPTGQTGTSLQVQGNVTNITTTTVSGPNAFNSFSQFGVSKGNTVNLQLPTGTQNLVNIVKDAPAYVNGTLNSYKDGSIGGNVYFADPYGFVVGSSGVVNVGSLNVSTPSREFVDKIISSSGQINAGAVTNLMNGTFPVSPDGNIRIHGRINAADGVRLTGQNVFVGGGRSHREMANQDHALKFSAAVNSKGLRSASGISVKNGSIRIGAVNNATVTGRLAARSKTTTPSNITVEAGNNVKIGKNANITTASKSGNAGDVILKAGKDITVKGGAVLNASSAKGNAGLVELSANGKFDVGNGVKINLEAPKGQAGKLVLDPDDMVVGDPNQDTGVTLSNATIASIISGLSGNATYQVTAGNSVTLAAHAIVDTRRLDGSGHSTGNAFNFEIVAPTIDIKQGAQILAQAVNFDGSTFTSGNVTLTANKTHSILSGQATATTSITVDGTISAANITINARSDAISSFTSNLLANFALVGESLAPAFLGLNGGYVAADATSTVNINSHANINGTGNVSINAYGYEKAEDPVLAGLINFMPFAASVVVGKIDGNVSTNVASGATINAGHNLSITAKNEAILNVAAVAAGSAQFTETVAYSKATVTTLASVATGANISVGTVSGSTGNTFGLTAVNKNSFSTSATSIGLSTPTVSGGAGGALAISDATTSVSAVLGASLGTGTANRMNASLIVEATSNNIVNSTMASTTVGTPALIASLQELALSAASPQSMIFQMMGPLFSASFDFKAAGALSIANSTQNATATIKQNPSGGAPNIYAVGDVIVTSNVIDVGVRSNATASAITSDITSGEATAVSAAVAWGNFVHNANAYIGGGTLINAANIAVDANTYLPITNTWLKWDGLSEVLRHLNGTLGVGSTILTSYANATADAGSTVAIAGAFNRFHVENNTTAWVATGASLTSTCTSNCGTSVTIDQGDVHNFTAGLTVQANTTTVTIDAGGNIGTFVVLPGNTSGGSSIGGAVNLVQFDTKTIAGISSGASAGASDDIAVNAITSDQLFAIAPSSGKAAGTLALNGITSVALLNNTTHASIGDAARVSAPTVAVLAQQDLSVISIAGAINAGGGSAVGLAVSYLGAHADTAAYIGDNHNDIRPGPFSSNDPFAGNGGGSGLVTADNLSVSATNSGRVVSVAFAASVSEPSVSNFAAKAGAATGAATGGTAGIAGGAAKIAQTSGSSPDGLSINIAGSSSVTETELNTTAYISGTTINRYTGTATNASTLVQALNYTKLDNASGSASFNLAGSPGSQSVAVGAAIASAMSDNATLAYIAGNTTINNHQAVSVQALSGGSETVIGIGIAGSRANSAALSASFGIITDSVTAYIQNATLNGLTGVSSRAIEVDAYQTTNIAIGGGTLFITGGQAGVGIGLTYAAIGNPDGGNAADAHVKNTTINNYDTLFVIADNASVIAAGAASGGLGANGAAGAIVVSEITSTTTAYISSSATVNVTIGSLVKVTADSVAVAALDTALTNLVKKSNNNQLATDNCTTSSGTQSCVDFSGAALNGGTGNGPGASIMSVAGIVQAGKNNVGASLVYDNIATTHSAYIAGVLLSASNVAVTASDSSKIQAVSVGFGLATGQFAGVGGMSISSIGNTVSAYVGNSQSNTSNSTITTFDLTVKAVDVSTIKGTAAVAGAATQGSAAGLALVYADIANNVNANINRSLVTASGSVNVNASSTATISTIGIGVALSSQVGLAGSVSTNLLGTNVTASITDGADVTANENVGVIAKNDDNAAVFAGAAGISKGAAGGAGSLVTNKITGTTAAYITGGSTKVDAKGNSGALSVNSGRLAHGIDLGAFAAPTDDTPDLSETQETVTGLAVVASSHQAVVTNVASVAASSGIAVMINPIVNVMSGATSAYINGASIDTRLTSTTALPQINVAATSFSYSGAFGLGIVAPTGQGGGGATIISTTMSRLTESYITNSTVGGLVSGSPTVGAVTVKAYAQQAASSVAVGFNSGSVGLNVFLATTEAYVDGGALTANSLSVKAENGTGIASANGSGAYGSQVAIGAAFLVQVSANKTLAYIGDEFHYQGNGAAHTTAVNLTGALEVSAKTINDFQAYSIGGALSTGAAAIAGMANIEIANNTTIAGIYDTTVQSPTGTTAGAISVTATEQVEIKEIAGAIAVAANGGGVGVGAAANVLVFKSKTIAETRNSILKSSGVVGVSASSSKEVLSYAVTAGGGGTVGIGAAIGVLLVGTNSADAETLGKETGQLNDTLASTNSGTNNNQGSGAVAAGTQGDPSNANAQSTYDVSSVLTGGDDTVTAQIAGGNVTGTQVKVEATSATAAKLALLGAGFAKNAGVGAAVGYANVSTSVLANLSAVTSAPSISVKALVKDASGGQYAGKTLDTEAVAGGGALYFGGDAAVMIGTVTNTVTAQLGGAVTSSGGTGISVTAADTSTQSATVGGAAGGIAAVGVSIATTAKSSSVSAKVLADTTVNTSTLVVGASENGALSASAYAVSGGIVSGNAAVATAKDSSNILAEIGSGASVTTSATGAGTLVSASVTPDLEANSIGAAFSGVAIGVSVALSQASANVTAHLGDNSTFSGGAVGVAAMALAPSGSTSTYAYALGSGGGSLVGAQGSYAQASESATVHAYGGTGIHLPSADVVITAQNDSSQYAEAKGLAFGYFAGGATIAEAFSDAHTYADLGPSAVTATSNTGVLQISATGTDTNVANAIAGAAGGFAGAAAVGTTNSKAVTFATLYGNGTQNTLYFGGLSVNARHTTNYAASGDAYQASFVGGSGGQATNTVVSTTAAEVGTNLVINSLFGDISVISNDIVDQAGGGARSGSGGIATGAAALSSSVVTQNVTTAIDAGTILSLNDDPTTSLAAINIGAYNTLKTTDSTSLTAGGLFAGGGAVSTMAATANINVLIDATEIFSAGNIYIGSAATMAANNYANANLYGAVTGAGASTNSALTAIQQVTVSGDTRIEGWGTINIYAGQSGDGSILSKVNANATTVVYNQALIPITATYSGTASARDFTTLTLAGGSQVLGANNIFLGATKGVVTADGNGTNYNPYLTLFSTKTTSNHSSTDGTGNVALNGVVVAGIHNDLTITIPVGATAPILSTTSPYALELEQVADINSFSPVMKWNHQKVQYTTVGGFNPYDTIVSQLATLSGKTTAEVQTILSGTDPTILITAPDPTGDIQRQVNTLIQQAPFAANVPGSAFAFGNILVSAGNVSILAQTLTGTAVAGKPAPSVTARDSVVLNIQNQGLNFMALSKLTVSGVLGGHAIFTGAATDATSTGITYHQDTTGTPPIIKVEATYNRKDPNTGQGVDLAGNPLTQTPDIYFDGTVTNVNGLLKITNALGNVVASKTYNAATIDLSVPNGSFTFNGGIGSIFNSNNDVASQWSGTQFRPTDTLTAVMTVATYLGTYGSVYLAGNGNWHPYSSFCCYGSGSNTSVGSGVAASDTIFTARLLNLYYDGLSLYSAIFLPAMSVPGGLAALEQANPAIVSTAPWERHTYDGQGVYGDSGSPFHCSGCAAYFQVVNIQSAAVTPISTNTAVNAPAPGTFAVGKAIILSASVLNINGTIQSGSSSNYSVDIGTNAKNYITALKSDADLLAAAKSEAGSGRYVDLTPYVTTVTSGDVKVGARYNALTDQVLLNGVIQGTGGYVYLNGKIISTSTNGSSQGNIVVYGGAGTITVNNSTGTDLVTNTINTGVTSASVIQIVDQLKQQTTWYVYNAGAPAGQQVTTYQANNVTSSGYQSASVVGVSGPSGIVYSPAPNQYYQWVDTATLDRPITSGPSDYGWHFSNVQANSPYGPYQRTTSLVQNVQQVVNGVATGQLQTANFQEVITATGDYHPNNFNTHADKCCGSDKQFDWFQHIFDHLTLTMTNTVKASYGIGISFNGGGSSSVAVTSNSNIVLNGPINNLQGVTSVAATGTNSTITVGATANNPLISGTTVTLSAPGGIGTLTADSKTPVPVQVYGGTLKATTNGGDIAIAATGSLLVDQIKAYNTSNPAQQGNIFLSATGDINSAAAYNPANPVIVGASIEINSSGGAIGAKSGTSNGVTTLSNINPLTIQTSATTLIDGSLDGGVLNSSSSTGTYIVQSSGDMRIGAISSNGPVFLAAAGSNGQSASILNGLTSGGLTAAQSKHLQDIWTDLSLLSGSGAAAVNDYQRTITSAYNDYWQMRNLAFADGSTYNLTATGETIIKAQLAGKLGTTPDQIDAAQVKAEAVSRFEKAEFLLGLKTANELTNSLTTLFGSNLASNQYLQKAPTNAALTTALTSYDANYSYTLDSNTALYSTITSGSKWTQDQLAYTVSAAAASGAPPLPIGDQPLNIKGRQVMLYAPNGSIGALAAPETFSFTSTDSSSLTAAQKGLLASAGPGQLSVSATTDPNTNVTSYTVSVSQQNLVMLNPLDSVAAKAQSQIYLGSAGDLVLGGIANATFGPVTGARVNGVQTVGGGDVKLDAVGSIVASAAAAVGQPVIYGNINNLSLISETGNIGKAPAAGTDPAANQGALQIAFNGPNGKLDQAVAAQGGIYLKQTTGDLVVGNVTAAGAIQFAATGSIYAETSFIDPNVVHIIGASLDVRSGGDVGFKGPDLHRLQVQISGAVTGSAVGDISILSPSNNLNVGTSGTWGKLAAGGTLTLNAASAALAINGGISSDGLMTLLANGAITFGAGTSAAPIVAESTNGAVTLASASLSMGAWSAIDSAGVITVATTGDATIGQLKSTLSYAAAGNAPSIIVSAGGVTAGKILSNGDSQINLLASGAGAGVSLAATAGIGTSANPVGINAALLSASTTDGSIYLKSFADLHASLVSAVKGNVDVLGTGNLTLDSVVAGTATGASGTFAVTATGGSIVLGTATSSGSQTVHADQNVTFKALSATGVTGGDAGNINVNADHGFILAQTVTSGGITTLGSVAANGLVSLIAGSTITGNTLTATNGSATLNGPGAIVWNTLGAGTTLNATSSADSITFKTAQSGGTQTIHADQNVTFNALSATGTGANINVNADHGFILAQTVISGGVTTQGSVDANGLVSLIAGSTITGNTLTATNGSATLSGPGAIVWNTLGAGTTLNATSGADSITFKTALSGGTQTIHADQNVTFNALSATGTGADINVNADHGFILAQTVSSGGVTTLGSVAAGGSAALTAASAITGNTLAAATGSVALSAGGAITWNTITAATTLDASSTGNSIGFGTAQAGGAMTLHAAQNVTFNQLTTTGIAGDAGNVFINADAGKIAGGSITANGSARLVAATSNTGNNLTTVTGAASLQGQLIDWANLRIAGALDLTATTGGIKLGTAISGGSQTLLAHGDIVFSQLTTTGIPGDAGDVSLVSTAGSILGGSVFANGDARFTTAGSIALDQLKGNSISLAAPKDLTVKFVSVVKQLDLAADTINVAGAQIMSNPSIPLGMNVTGFNGGIATSAHIVIDPDAIIINQYRVVDSTFVTDAPSVTILNGLVPGQMMLTTAFERVLMDNRTPLPSAWPTLQLYQPGGAFNLAQIGNVALTNSYVVQYTGDISATVSTYLASHSCCAFYTGASMLRTVPSDIEGYEPFNSWQAQKTTETFYLLGVPGSARLDAWFLPRAVDKVGPGPAVNTEGLSQLKKLRRLQQTGRTGWRSTALDGAEKQTFGRIAAAW